MIRIALYMRLSKEDALASAKRESGSIRTQRMLLQEYVKAHFQDYELSEFMDDGYSGTNFQRPGVTQLLELVRGGRIDCVIVKDFSRFSRDYIELGSYLEQIFPFLGIRFISINDGYDSADGAHRAGELEISFRNLLYDLYSKDLSIKVKSSLHVKKNQGQYVSANSPFGYEKASDDPHMLLVEEDEAKVVRYIFNLALQGHTLVEIARMLNEEGVKTPVQFKIEKGKMRRTPKKGGFVWQPASVCQILHNEVYVGHMVYGKTEKEMVGGKNRLKPREQWNVCRNHHEAIIDCCTFEEIQAGWKKKIQRKKERILPVYEAEEREYPSHPLTGKLVCGGCGRRLYIRKGTVPSFVCPCRTIRETEGCVGKIEAALLEEQVVLEIQKKLRQSTEADKKEMEKRRKMTLEEELQDCRKKKKAAIRKKAVLTKQKLKAYESYVAGETDVTGYHEAADAILEKEQHICSDQYETDKKMKELEKQLIQGQKGKDGSGYFTLSKLTRHIVLQLIEEIVVYREKKVEIHWRPPNTNTLLP